MTVSHSVRHSVKRALATGTMALIGAGGMAAYAQPASTAQATTAQMPASKATAAKATTANTATAKSPIRLAQTTPPPPATAVLAPPVLQTVVVTGTMIARPQVETAEAITIIQANALKNMGVVNVEQAVDDLTANVPGVNIAQSVSTFDGGGSFANLRDLGLGRTLVLLDGQRLADNVVAGSSVDLSGIPFSSIQSVQVLREGASSLYGSDAIAGVINFITKKDYQGGEVNVDLDRPQEAGGSSGEADFTFGHGDLLSNGYNFMITGDFTKQQSLTAAQRSFASTGFNPALGLENQNGPTATWPGSYTDANGNLWQVGYPACAGNPHLTEYFGNCAYEYSGAVDLLPTSSEASAMAEFTKELPANNTVALQYFYTQSNVKIWSGPQSYSFTMTPTADPTYYPTAAESTCYGNTVTGGPCTAAPDVGPGSSITAGWTDPNNNRYLGDLNTEQRILLTFAGDNAGWDYTANLNYSVNKNNEDVDGGEANYSIIAPGGVLSNLIDPFGPQTAAGQALIDSAYLNGSYADGKLELYSIDAHASHKLGDAFHTGHPAVLAIGASAEEDRIDFASTPLAVTLYPALYFPPTDITGSRNEQAIFSELDVPMSKSVDVDISDREDKYSDFGETNNGKVSVRYQPVRYVTFRGAASTGFRAPSLVDLYQPDTFGADGGVMGETNPTCISGDYNAEFSKVVCTSQGLALAGGNRNLQPETSQNFDFGVIVEPVTNLGVTVDYYRVLIKNALGTIPDTAIYGDPAAFTNDIVLNSSGTFTPAPESNTFCQPSYTASTCGYIIQTVQNTGGITTDGFDLSAKYFITTPLGDFGADVEGTMITHYRLTEYTGGPALDLVGWFNDGNQPAIHWQHIIMLNWRNPSGNWGAGITNRFFSSYIDEFDDAANNQIRVSAQSTWDVYASYKPINPLTVLFGVNNVFNTVPPFSNQTTNWPAGYNPNFSSPLLRTFYLNLRYDF